MKLQSESFGMCLLKSSAQGVVPDTRDSPVFDFSLVADDCAGSGRAEDE